MKINLLMIKSQWMKGIVFFVPCMFVSIYGVSQYCTTGLYTSGGCQWGDDVGVVQFNTINNVTNNCPGGSSGYADYTNISTAVCKGRAYMIAAGTSSFDYSQGFAAWIDYNQDQDFDDPGEFIFASPGIATYPTTFSDTVVIPQTALAGPTRLRIRRHYFNTITETESCSDLSFGETEDYTVIIGAPDSLSFSLSDSINCVGDTVSATVYDYGGLSVFISMGRHKQSNSAGCNSFMSWYLSRNRNGWQWVC